MAEIHFREVADILCEAFGEREESWTKIIQEHKEACIESSELCEEYLYEKAVISAIGVDEEYIEESKEIVEGLILSLADGMDLGFCYLDGVIYARIFDGERYLFPLPFLLTDDADAKGACINIAEYSVKYMIPLIITDVPRDELDFLRSVFPHIDGSSYDGEDDDTFYIKVNNECDLLDEIPTVELDGITLCPFTEDDRERYAELCRDRELNQYWGYDADEDNPDGDADFYLDTVKFEFDDGIALTLAVREGDELVGEATVYGFDFRGSASIAVRVMRDCHGRGIGSRATGALIELAREMGLSTLKAEILEENQPSVKMTSKFMDLEKCENGKAYFTLNL
jgi:RimJ/RimL family protein N-acetyltransferase